MTIDGKRPIAVIVDELCMEASNRWREEYEREWLYGSSTPEVVPVGILTIDVTEEVRKMICNFIASPKIQGMIRHTTQRKGPPPSRDVRKDRWR